MTIEKFKELYKKLNGLDTFPPPTPTGTDPLDDQDDIVPDDISK
jgi:hypothetical protein